MDGFIAALWELRTWFTLTVGVTIGLVTGALLTMSKRHEPDEDGPPTILILPPDEPMEQVDIKSYVRRYS